MNYIQSDYNVRKLESTISNGKMSPHVLVEVWVVRNATPLKYVPGLCATIDCNVLVVKIVPVSSKHSLRTDNWGKKKEQIIGTMEWNMFLLLLSC